jgi:hypothetical protein
LHKDRAVFTALKIKLDHYRPGPRGHHKVLGGTLDLQTVDAQGISIEMPLATQPSGAAVGWLTDRFGIHWTVTIDPA